MSDDYAEFELYDGDELVAGASGKRVDAWKEILHYVYVDVGQYVGTIPSNYRVEEITRNIVEIGREPPKTRA